MRSYSVIVGSIDEVVSSRVHVSLRILSFTPEGREQIWKMLFETFIRQHPDVLVDSGAKGYATTSAISKELKLNGLEMRNGIFSSVNQGAANADPIL